MPSQRPGPAAAAAHDYAAATPSPSKPRGNPRYSGCVPATVRHIARSLAAADAGGDPAFSIDGVKTSNVRVLGKVEAVVSAETDVSFTLDDGTGKIPLVRWAGVYVRVHVDITGFQTNQQGFARSIRPITNFNEVVLHFIECIHVHIENTRPKMQETFPPAVQTNAYTQVPYTGGVTEHQVHFAPQVNQGQLLPAARTNASTYAPFTGGVREHQVHFAPQVNQGQFHPTVQTNRSTYGPFSGGSSAYSGTGGQQHDLQSKVLKVLQAPDIMTVINLLADSGFVCWTIDDFHVKCAVFSKEFLSALSNNCVG
ncbi:replication protein A 32 kDa subunit C-like [Lolium rigidum]|uniref:replication protein A 32 kDa subunit C-like n=1 Tax=Lolium rigidum TaxID=89674 RepID=UPI001F5DA6CE|nr:replication protein A 32 kDa subunit C-like [Lolium rigidum]